VKVFQPAALDKIVHPIGVADRRRLVNGERGEETAPAGKTSGLQIENCKMQIANFFSGRESGSDIARPAEATKSSSSCSISGIEDQHQHEQEWTGEGVERQPWR